MRLSQAGFETNKITSLNEMHPTQDLLQQTRQSQISKHNKGIN